MPHNFALYDAKGGKAFFNGEIQNTEGERTYKFTTPAAGSYYFQCDVHPDQMNGSVVVAQDASKELAPGAEGSGNREPSP